MTQIRCERETGLDVLRNLSMLGVVMVHILGHGGMAGHLSSPVAGATQVLAYPAVNCFVLLSGYLLWNKPFRLVRLTRIWLQAIFWSVLIQCASFVLLPQTRGLGTFVYMFLPILSGRYWFLNAYVVMLIFSPAINHLIRNFGKTQCRGVLLAGTLLFCIARLLALGNDVFGVQNGYHFSWFMMLYFVGGYLGKYVPRSKGPAMRGYFLSSVLLLVWILAADHLEWNRGVLLQYTSPLVSCSAICLLQAFQSMEMSEKNPVCRFCAWASPCVFAVYLIHDHPLIREYFIAGRFSDLRTCIAAMAGIYFGCIALDALRQRLFRLLKIDRAAAILSDWVEGKVRNYLKG